MAVGVRWALPSHFCTRSSVSSRARGDRHGAVDAGPALFQALDHQYAGGEVHAINGEGESLEQPAVGIGEGHAEGAHLAIGALGFPQEGGALA